MSAERTMTKLLFGPSVRKLGLALGISIAAGLCAGIAAAQTKAPELFVPVPESRSGGPVPAAQQERIAQLRREPTTKSVQLMMVDLSALKSESTKFSFPGERALTFSGERELALPTEGTKSPGEANFVWHGTLRDVPGTATLVVHNGNITGTVQDGSQLYRIEPVGGGVHAIVGIDASKFPPGPPAKLRRKSGRDTGPAWRLRILRRAGKYEGQPGGHHGPRGLHPRSQGRRPRHGCHHRPRHRRGEPILHQ